MEVYDRNMNYLRNIHHNTDHSDLAVDQNGVEWLVVYNFQTGNGGISKVKLSDGYSVDLTGPQWNIGEHISCQTRRVNWCIFSTIKYSTSGWLALEAELIKVYLDSTVTAPHIERLVHHRSDWAYADNPSSCPNLQYKSAGYWAQPSHTSSRDGSEVIFGSTWGQNCFIESYLINLGSSSDVVPPAAPTGLSVS